MQLLFTYLDRFYEILFTDDFGETSLFPSAVKLAMDPHGQSP